MKERYVSFMDNITPEKSDKELLKAVLDKAQKKEKIKMTKNKALKKAVVIPIAAAMALTLSVAGGAAIYSGLSYLRTSELTKSTEAAESIQTGVFTDSTEHIRMTVEEYLSDGIAAYATVKYEALDDYGKEWLADYSFTKGYDSSNFALKPCTLEYGSKYGNVSHSLGKDEIEELKTETERYFYVTLECNSDDYDGGIAFCYIMNNHDFREVQFEKCTIELKNYALSSESQASGYFTPTYLRISDLSFTVYAENHGVYETTGYSTWITVPEDEYQTLTNNLKPTLVMKNGEKVLQDGGWALGSSWPSDLNFGTDLVVCAGSFTRLDENTNRYVNYSVDTDNIAGIEICGVYYEATPIE